jgi:hypothetical protein
VFGVIVACAGLLQMADILSLDVAVESDLPAFMAQLRSGEMLLRVINAFVDAANQVRGR